MDRREVLAVLQAHADDLEYGCRRVERIAELHMRRGESLRAESANLEHRKRLDALCRVWWIIADIESLDSA